mmetsp:Transcript_16392/g.29613  ORF Transcript_16392/g.29613 Transcript_16392/m.29613 type:complete len:82 (-) Transcript_16392:695-940(-)
MVKNRLRRQLEQEFNVDHAQVLFQQPTADSNSPTASISIPSFFWLPTYCSDKPVRPRNNNNVNDIPKGSNSTAFMSPLSQL